MFYGVKCLVIVSVPNVKGSFEFIDMKNKINKMVMMIKKKRTEKRKNDEGMKEEEEEAEEGRRKTLKTTLQNFQNLLLSLADFRHSHLQTDHEKHITQH